ncbi:hypothetical protein TNCV_2085161 [Trichonephila clavipes]|uniref:Uncharacterized protein n=1 Tax=Trichonephila clavipes TaxID=2585209 RepID=A0A8X6RIJ0_TRICX|nr:hypothetical protein TNCV_2085161 [Trichonephila clavipes]
MVNQARYKNNRSIQFSFGVVLLSCKVAAPLSLQLSMRISYSLKQYWKLSCVSLYWRPAAFSSTDLTGSNRILLLVEFHLSIQIEIAWPSRFGSVECLPNFKLKAASVALLNSHTSYIMKFPSKRMGNMARYDLLAELKKKGHYLHLLGSGMLGIIMGVLRGDDGFLYANSDYRKGGEVDGF